MIAAPTRAVLLSYCFRRQHLPHQPKADRVEKFKGKFAGWNAMRDKIFANRSAEAQSRQGQAHRLAGFLPKWDTLSADHETKMFAARPKVHAAITALTDTEIGRVSTGRSRTWGQLDNTLLIYIDE